MDSDNAAAHLAGSSDLSAMLWWKSSCSRSRKSPLCTGCTDTRVCKVRQRLCSLFLVMNIQHEMSDWVLECGGCDLFNPFKGAANPLSLNTNLNLKVRLTHTKNMSINKTMCKVIRYLFKQ